MPLAINTSEINGPYNQAGHLYGYNIPVDDYDARAAVSKVYHKGGRELLPHEQADRLELHKKKTATSLPGFFSSIDGVIVISPFVYREITGLQKEGIQVWPISLTHKDQPITDEPWYILNVWQRVASIDHDNSSLKEVKGFDGVVRKQIKYRDEQTKIAMHSDKVEGLHIWRDDDFPRTMLMSDQLADILESDKKNLKGVSRFRTIVV